MAGSFGCNFATGLLIGCAIALAVAAAAIAYERYDTKTLKRTVRRDAVYCGVNTGLPGFSAKDDKGKWSGFDVDFCRAIAAAIFNDPNKVNFIPLDAKERFEELGKRKVDVLARNSTWTMSREAEYGLHFAGVSYYDGQGFMVPRARNIEFGAGARRQQGLRAGRHHDRAQPRRLLRRQPHEVRAAEVRHASTTCSRRYDSGQCDALTADVSQLYALRLKLAKPADHVILADVISKEPLARWCGRRTTTGCCW